jgi:hypothetical protein
MTTTTRKILLTDEYTKLIENIKKYTNIKVLPILDEDLDLVDMILYFNYYFLDCKTIGDYRRVVLSILESNNILLEPAIFETIFVYIYDFLVWYKALK